MKIEDNLGESIHIHYGQIRMDLSVEEFERLEASAENILDQMNELIHAENIGWRDLNPIFLQNPKNTNILYKLQGVSIASVKLKDIYVDSYVRLPLIGRVSAYRPLKHSRVVKALEGNGIDNDEYKQLNEVFITNSERVHQNMEEIRKYGYPADGRYIILNSENMIIDGQHRSACLYSIYGPKHEIPVMRWEFEDTGHLFFPKKRSVFGIAVRAYRDLIKRSFSKFVRLPIRAVNMLKRLSGGTGKQTTAYKNVIPGEICLETEKDIFMLLNSHNIPYIKLDSDVMTMKHGADLAILISREHKVWFEAYMQRGGYRKDESENALCEYLYSVERDCWFEKNQIKVHVFYQMLCKSFYEQAFLPISQSIEKRAWSTKQYTEDHGYWQMDREVKTLLLIVQCVYFEKRFSEKRKEQLTEYMAGVNRHILQDMLSEVFFGFTEKLMDLMNCNCFDLILGEYQCFRQY